MLLILGLGARELAPLAIALVFLVVVFLIFREFFCWYWKINRIVSLLEDISGSLARMAGNRPESSSHGGTQPLSAPDE